MEIRDASDKTFVIVHSDQDFDDEYDAWDWGSENAGSFRIRKLPNKEKYRVYYDILVSASLKPSQIKNFVSYGYIY